MDSGMQKYRALVQTVACGSFTRAAQALDYAQSSVSKMIADLEAEWGVTVLERSRAGVELTSDGIAMLPYVRELLDCYASLQEQAAALRGVQRGTIRVGVFSSVATHWMPNIIRAFQRDYPQIQYEMLLGDYREIEQWIGEGRVECGFLRLPTRDSFETISLERDEFVLVLPEGHPLTGRERIAPEDLNGEPFLLLEHGGKNEVSEYLERLHLHPDVRFTTWDDYAILSMAESGLGIGILPRLILRRIPYRVQIRPLTDPPCREIGLAARKGKPLSAAVRRFIPYLKYREDRGADGFRR